MKRVIRRLKQFHEILFSRSFFDQEQVNELSNSRYTDPSEMNYYIEIAKEGLDEKEKPVLSKVISEYLPKKEKALVMGCGTGREMYGLKDDFKQVFGVDSCAAMIETAKKIMPPHIASSHFYLGSHLKDYKENNFDLIYLTVTLSNHIKGSKNRIQFYRSLKEVKSSDGVICSFTNIFPLKPYHHFFWASQMLRLKAKVTGGDWEQGDSIRSYLGSHSKINMPIFFHFDQSQDEIRYELEQAGLVPSFLEHNFWLAK